MNEYKLIELNRREGAKNIICQLLAPRKEISLDEVIEMRSYVVAIDDGVRYCLTGIPILLTPLLNMLLKFDKYFF